MMKRVLASLLAASAVPVLAGPPTSQPSVVKVPQGANVVKLKRASTMKVEKVAGLPGEKKTLSATLKETRPATRPFPES